MIGVQRAALRTVSVVTFAGGDHGVVTFAADLSVDAVVAEMYRRFQEGRYTAENQIEASRRQSENNPKRNNEWRQIRNTDPPEEAFRSTGAPVGDPNSLYRANDMLRLRDQITVRPRTPPKAAPSPVTPPKAAAKAGPTPPSAPPPWMPEQQQQQDQGQHGDWQPPALLNPHRRWIWSRQHYTWVWRPDYDIYITNPYSPVYYPSDDEIWTWMTNGWNDYTMRWGILNL